MATGPAAVKSCEPILQPPTAPSSRSSSASASSSRSTSRATSTRSCTAPADCSGIGVILLQATHLLLALEQRLDRADGGLGAVQGEVVGNVLSDRGVADRERVLAGAAVLRRVEHQLDVAGLHEVEDVGPVVVADLVRDLHRHPLPLEHVGGAGGGHQREAKLDQA